VATCKDVNDGVNKPEACIVESIKWAIRRDLNFDTAKMEEALFTCMRSPKQHLWPELTAKIQVGDCLVWFMKDAAQRLGVWMDDHLPFN